jgi:hypothetical protein
VTLRSTFTRTATIALAAAALAAPSALARAADPSEAVLKAAAALAAPDGPTQVSAIVGDSPADFAQPVAPAFTVGDTPSDHPGMSRAPKDDPPATIQVVRPERTIVRNANQALPTLLAGLALLVALGGAGFVLVRTRSLQRGVVGRSH